jgi:hypothetical protein
MWDANIKTNFTALICADVKWNEAVRILSEGTVGY